jgi:hypothetical protein
MRRWLTAGNGPVRTSSATAENPISHSQAVESCEVLQSVRQGMAHGRALGGMETGKNQRGAPGVDSETIEGIESRGEEEQMLSQLQQQLRAKSYRFHPVRRVDIPKPKGAPVR